MSDSDKLLPDIEIGVSTTKGKQKRLADVPTELPIEDEHKYDSKFQTESRTDTDSDGDSDGDSDSDSDSEYECGVCDIKISGYIPFKQHEKGKRHAKMVQKKKREKKLTRESIDDDLMDDDNLIPEPYATCETCDKQFFDPEAYHMHLKSKNHKRKILEESILEQVREKGEINADKLKALYKGKNAGKITLQNTNEKMMSLKLGDDGERARDEFECKECEKVFSGLTPYTQHLISKTHEKQVEKNMLMHKVISDPNECKISDESQQTDLNALVVEDDILVCKICSTSFSGPESGLMHLKSKNHSKSLVKYLRKLERKKEKKESKKSISDCAKREQSDRPVKEKAGETTGKAQQPKIGDVSNFHTTGSPLKDPTKTAGDKVEEEDYEENEEEKQLPESGDLSKPHSYGNLFGDTAKAAGDKVEEEDNEEDEEEKAKEKQPPESGDLSKPHSYGNLFGDTKKSSRETEVKALENYKKYKDLMHSLKEDNV